MLDPEVWGRGYATEAAAAVLRRAFEHLGLERVVSIIHPESERSLRVARRLGLAPWRAIPWDDRGIDLDVYAIRRPEPPALQSLG